MDARLSFKNFSDQLSSMHRHDMNFCFLICHVCCAYSNMNILTSHCVGRERGRGRVYSFFHIGGCHFTHWENSSAAALISLLLPGYLVAHAGSECTHEHRKPAAVSWAIVILTWNSCPPSSASAPVPFPSFCLIPVLCLLFTSPCFLSSSCI